MALLVIEATEGALIEGAGGASIALTPGDEAAFFDHLSSDEVTEGALIGGASIALTPGDEAAFFDHLSSGTCDDEVDLAEAFEGLTSSPGVRQAQFACRTPGRVAARHASR